MAVDTRFLVDQFALCARYAALGQTKSSNSLLPQSYGRVQTSYLKQNRKETFAVAYGDVGKAYVYPESLQVLASSYIKATLPANGSGNYKQIPGLFIIDKYYVRCNGDLVYSGCYQTLMSDHLASLRDEDARAFAESHLGYIPGADSGAERKVWLPIPLPNSSIWRYGGRGQGALPFASFRNNKIEVSFDFFDNTHTAADRDNASPAMTGTQICHKEVICSLQAMPTLKDARGRYAIVSRRLTQLADWTDANSGVEQNLVVSNLSGCVTEIIIEACAQQANRDRCDIQAPLTPSSVKLICDSVECVNQESEDEAKLIEYSHGYRTNDFYSGNTYRLVFGSHGSESDRCFQGAINFNGVTQANLKFAFGVNATYRVTAVQLGVTSISSTGRLTQKID